MSFNNILVDLWMLLVYDVTFKKCMCSIICRIGSNHSNMWLLISGTISMVVHYTLALT